MSIRAYAMCMMNAALVSSCRDLMQQIGDCNVQHIYREKNCVADGLANWSYNMDLGVCTFEDAPVWISSLLADDLLGFARSCLISSDAG